MSDLHNWSGTAASNNASPPDGFPEGMNYAQVNDGAREIMAAVYRYYADLTGSLTTGGAANAYTITPNRTIASYAVGTMFVAKANHTNTGAATINVSSLGAKAIVRPDGSALTAGEIQSGGIYRYTYDGTSFQLGGAASTVSSTLTLTATTVVDLADGSAVLVVGPSTGQHLEFDQDEIQSKSSATAAAILALNRFGGTVNIGAQSGAGSVVLYDAGTVRLTTNSSGLAATGRVTITQIDDTGVALVRGAQTFNIYVEDADNSFRIYDTTNADTAAVYTPNGGWAFYRNNLLNVFSATQGFGVQSTTGSTTSVAMYSTAGALEGAVYTFNSANMLIRSELTNRGVDLVGVNSAVAYASLFTGDPNGIAALYFAGQDRLRTQTNGGSAGNAGNVSPASGVGQMLFTGSGYTGAVALDGTAMYIGHNSGSRGLNLVTSSTQLGVAITAGGSVGLYNNGTEEFRTQLATGAANTSGAEVRDFGGTFRDVGFNIMPVTTNNSATTLSRTHLSTLQTHVSGTVAWTTPASSDTDFPTGGVVNGASSAAGLTIVAGSGVTLSWFTGSAVTTGTRTIAAGGVFTLVRSGSADFYLWGSGIS